MRYVSDFVEALKYEQQRLRDAMAAGTPATFEAYQRLVGQNQGLEKALDILNNLLKEEDPDDRFTGGFE